MPFSPVQNNLVALLEAAWYRGGSLRYALWPFSLMFRALVALRRRSYQLGIIRGVRVPIPVVIVGNITVGGAGKTPLTIAVAKELAGRGWQPALVSRGYGGTVRGPRAVQVGDDADEVGDEALLLVKAGFPTYIGRDRAAAARAALAAHPHCDVIVADDGLQHYRLVRDVEIVVIDAARGLGNGELLPAGPLREPLSRLRSVTAVVCNGIGTDESDSCTGRMAELHDKVFAMRLHGEAFYLLTNPVRRGTATEFAERKLYAAAGIGNPERFFRTLRAMGLAPRCQAFADHHRFSVRDFEDAGDIILITEKDAVKCRAFADERFWVLPVSVDIPAALVDSIEETLRGSEIARNSGMPHHQGASHP